MPARRPGTPVIELLALLLMLGVVGLFRLSSMSAYAAPPGSDAGNWLAFGRELFGEDVKAAISAYPPVFPAVYWGISKLTDPLLAGKLLATLTSVIGAVPVYLIGATAASKNLALVGATAFAAAGYRSEVVAFGGYPQLLAEAFTLAALWLLVSGTVGASTKRVIIAAFLAGLAIGTHHLTTAYMGLATLVVAFVLLLQGIRPRRVFRSFLVFLVFGALFASPYVPSYLVMKAELAASPFNVQQWAISTSGETFAYIFRNSVGVWYILLGMAIGGIISSTGSEHVVARTTAISSLLAPVGLFLWLGEVRFLQFIFAGIAIGAVLFVSSLSRRHTSTPSPILLGSLVLLVSVAAVCWGGILFTKQAFSWYQVIDQPRLEALEWLKSGTPEGALIVSTPAKNGLVLGWWIEGYAGRRTIVGSDPRWMAFRQEKEHAELANSVLALLRSGDDAAALDLLVRSGVSYLFLDRSAWPQPSIASPAFRRVFENGAVVIFRTDKGL